MQQFEDLNHEVIARLFQRAVDDAESWIDTMVQNGELPDECVEPIKAKEAKAIHNILIKYASIGDIQMREDILNEMLRITKNRQN